MIEKTKLDEIKKGLPHGALKLIQKKANVSYLTVCDFFKGKSENVDVCEAVILIYKEHQSRITTLNGLGKQQAGGEK